MPAIISDTSCLILLDKIEALLLLQKLFGSISVTKIVADEFGKELPDWIQVHTLENENYLRILLSTLDKGEASSIALALEQKDCLLIIDEQKGRKQAKQLGLKITGTLGVLAQAKLQGYLASLSPVLERVKQTDFRISENLIRETRKQVGEL